MGDRWGDHGRAVGSHESYLGMSVWGKGRQGQGAPDAPLEEPQGAPEEPRGGPREARGYLRLLGPSQRMPGLLWMPLELAGQACRYPHP